MVVVTWCWKEASPLIEKGLPYSFFQGRVPVVHQGLGGGGQGQGDQV